MRKNIKNSNNQEYGTGIFSLKKYFFQFELDNHTVQKSKHETSAIIAGDSVTYGRHLTRDAYKFNQYISEHHKINKFR